MIQKLLFVIPNLGSGGAQKSLVSLLNSLDSRKYQIDLFLFQRNGLFMNLLPKTVHILDPCPAVLPIKQSVSCYLKQLKWIHALKRILYSVYVKVDAQGKKQGVRSWRLLKTMLPQLKQEYDAAIAYGDGEPMYFVIDNTVSKKKILWNHIDYIQYHLNPIMDRDYYKKADYIVTISDSCKKVLESVFPDQSGKMKVIENIVSSQLITKMAEEQAVFGDENSFDGIRLITIGRLSAQKGYDIAVPALRLLLDRGFHLRWYAIGAGEKEEEVRALISANGLNHDFILLKEQINPYAFMRKADIYVQTSRYEGKPIAIEEAKLLCKPILTTKYPTVSDSIQNGVNGYLVDLTPEAVANGIAYLLENEKVRIELSAYLQTHLFSNEQEVLDAFAALV